MTDVTSTPAAGDDNDDLVLDDEQTDNVEPGVVEPEPAAAEPETQGAPEVADPTGTATSVIDEADRVIPPTVDPSIDNATLESFVFVLAHHNLPAWNSVAGGYLQAARYDDGGALVNSDECHGWIPNNEEGVRAVELGFAELVEVPEGVEPPSA